MNIVPEKDLYSLLSAVESPGRYVGGEFGARMAATDRKDFLVALCFPDLYEIGMSNTAIKLLYSMINETPGCRAERVFAPGRDMEEALSAAAIPLYTLESGIPLSECDMVAFSVGYELAATTVLQVLHSGHVTLWTEERADGEPIVLAGGPGVTNPIPWAQFFDAVFVGEAETVFVSLLRELAGLRRQGAPREQLLKVIQESPHLWYRGRKTPVRRAIWSEFGRTPRELEIPVPNIRTVQDHGVVEIMRGCPQGCRFCSAGIYYRPYRMKSPELIEEEVSELIHRYGYREVTLSSLSSGDYAEIGPLFRRLNTKFGDQHVSFSLPSLRVNSFTLPLLEELSHVRRAGLTFAVETPDPEGQHGLNKLVPLEKTIEILREARERGWRVAKFYFMIGLPVTGGSDEKEIVRYFDELARHVKINLNVNIAAFVPKPHTPFQWAPQLTESEALDKIMYVRRELKHRGIKVGYQAPFQSLIEGVISRGDERAAQLIYEAFRGGSRLDAWEEFINRDAWRAALADAPWEVEREICRPTEAAERLPWDVVRIGVGKNALWREYERSKQGELTEQCAPECAVPCGVCNNQVAVNDLSGRQPAPEPKSPPAPANKNEAAALHTTATSLDPNEQYYRVIFSFSKKGKATFIPHLSLMGVFERACVRAGIPVKFSQGYNPKPRLQFAQPLSVGISSEDEIAALDLQKNIQPEMFCELINAALPSGLIVMRAANYHGMVDGKKNQSMMSLFWGGTYHVAVVSPARSKTAAGGRDVSGRVEFVAARLREAVGTYEIAVPPDGTSLSVTLESRNGQVKGISKLLTELWGTSDWRGEIAVTRTNSFAQSGEGNRESYFDLFARIGVPAAIMAG